MPLRPQNFPPVATPVDEDTPGVFVQPTGLTNFYRSLEGLIRIQKNRMVQLESKLYGYDVCVFNPVMIETQYDDEAQDFAYSSTEDYTGRLLIAGMERYLSFGATDQWSGENIILHLDCPTLIDIQENAKVVITEPITQRRHVFKTKFLRKIVLHFIEVRKEYQLIPIN